MARSDIEVLLFPNQKLRRRADKLPSAVFGSSPLRDYCQILANCLKSVEAADVLAATQISFDPAWQVLALLPANVNGAVAILCNPEVRDESGEQVGFERCASFACTPALLSAPEKLVVEYRTPEGQARKVECKRSGARAVFQGVESLKGKIVLDRMTLQGAHQYVRRYREEIEERLAPKLFLPSNDLVIPS